MSDRWNEKTIPAKSTTSPTPEPAPSSPFDPPRERFQEGDELGRGGMGRVFEARDVALDRPVAIKQSLGDDPAMLLRFEREVRITARLQHPGIVPVLDAGRDAEGHPYYVMRKIEGRPLADKVREARGAVARLAFVPNMLAAVDAVAYAHARGIIHRDLKPWNILLGPFGETFVIDWGLARDLAASDADAAIASSPGDGLTQTGKAFGTPGFMSPEQARGDSADRRADVYALGATLVHLLTGASPFTGVAPTVAIEMAARNEAPTIEFPPEIPAELVAIATKAMSATPDTRYADAGELAVDLRAFLTGQLVAAHEYTLRERFVRWSRRHRVAVAVATAVVIAIAVISVLAIRNVLTARDASDARERAADRADEMLLDRAYALAPRDPAYALALLRLLRPVSTKWERARVVAETAAAYGVGWGMPLAAPNAFSHTSTSPDGTAIAVTSEETVFIVEPSLRTAPRELFRGKGRVSQLEWISTDALVGVHNIPKHPEIIRIAIDGSVRTLDVGAAKKVELINANGDGRVFARLDEHLRELDVAGGPPTTDFGAVRTAQRVAGGLIYEVGGHIVVHADGHEPLPIPGFDLYGRYAVANLALGRLALGNGPEVVEFALGELGWVERGRWQIDFERLGYVRDRLVVVETTGVATLTPNKPPYREVFEVYQRSPRIANGLIDAPEGMFVPGDRAIFFSARFGAKPVPILPFADPLISVEKAGPYLVGLEKTGTLRSWDLRTVLPRVVDAGAPAQPVRIDDKRAWLVGQDHLFSVDIDTGTRNPVIAAELDQSSYVCTGSDRVLVRIDANKRQVLKERARVDVLDPETGTMTTVPGSYEDASCSPAEHWLGLALKTGVEIRTVAAPATPGRTFDVGKPIRGFRFSEHWLAIVDTADELTLVDLATERRTKRSLGPIEGLAVDDAGRVAVVKHGEITLYTKAGPQTVARHVSLDGIHAHPVGFLVFTRDRSLIVIDHAAQVHTYDIGEQATSVATLAPRVAIILDGRVALLDPRDGSLVRFPWLATRVELSRDGNSFVATSDMSARILRTHVPDDPAKLRAWLDSATNARLEPGSTSLTWR